MKLGIVACKVDILVNGKHCFKQGEIYPVAIYKSKIKSQNELGLSHIIADSHHLDLVLEDEYFKSHFDLIKQ